MARKTEDDDSLKGQGIYPVWLFVLLGYCCLIYGLSSQSHLPSPLLFSGQDKLIHATAYAIMAWIFWQIFSDYRLNRPCLLAGAAVIFCSLYGISDEWHQSFVAGRDASAWDWLADTLGAIVLSGVRLYMGKAGQKGCPETLGRGHG